MIFGTLAGFSPIIRFANFFLAAPNDLTSKSLIFILVLTKLTPHQKLFVPLSALG